MANIQINFKYKQKTQKNVFFRTPTNNRSILVLYYLIE